MQLMRPVMTSQIAVLKADTLQYAADALRADRDIVLTAARQNGYALEFARLLGVCC